MTEFRIESLSTSLRNINRRTSSLKSRPAAESSCEKSLPFLAGRIRRIETPKSQPRNFHLEGKFRMFKRTESIGDPSELPENLQKSFEILVKNKFVGRESSSQERIAKRLGNMSLNMDVRDEYSANKSIDKKMRTLLGPYKYSNRFKDQIKRLQDSYEEPSRDRFLEPTPNKAKNFASDLEKIIKRRMKVKTVDSTTKAVSLLKEFKERSDALQKDEPMLDCFIKMKKEGHFDRENPLQVTNNPTYFREVRDHPIHKVAKGGYKRNRFGIPFIWN